MALDGLEGKGEGLEGDILYVNRNASLEHPLLQ